MGKTRYPFNELKEMTGPRISRCISDGTLLRWDVVTRISMSHHG